MFHYIAQLASKDIISFMSLEFTLVPDQKKKPECDLFQDDFLKEFECMPGNKAHFEYKTKILA